MGFDGSNESDQGSILTVAYPGFKNAATSADDRAANADADDAPSMSRDGDALPAPVNADTIAVEAQPLYKIYGDSYQQAAKSSTIHVPDEPKQFLPMVADNKQAAPLDALGASYDVSKATPEMMKSTCQSACASRTTQAQKDGCIASCQSKNLGIEVQSYDNQVDFLRPLLPQIKSSTGSNVNF